MKKIKIYISTFEPDKLGVPCCRVCVNKKSDLYWLNREGGDT